jgi:hypothetical protein
MNKQLLIISIMLTAAAGCAPAVKKEEVLAEANKIKAANLTAAAPGSFQPLATFAPAASPLSAGETLVYKAKYFGIPIGEFVIVNKGRTTLNGRPAYCFELSVHTLPFFGIVKDRYVSYMDPERLVVLRHEEYVVKAKAQVLESAVDFDYGRGRAFYKNALTGEAKETAIPAEVSDIVTGGFYLRRAPLGLGDTLELNIYADEKLYTFVGLLHSKTKVQINGQGTVDALLLKAYLFKGGEPVNNITAEVFFSTDPYRKPLRAVLKTFLGNVSVTLE